MLASFFLNYISLPAGQAIYLPANEPHAYVSGQLVEVMATSDNVVRAGLTPKLRDTVVLCSMLTYVQGRPDILAGTPVSRAILARLSLHRRLLSLADPIVLLQVDGAAAAGGVRHARYCPPFDEFQLDLLAAPAEAPAFQPELSSGPGILLVVGGAGKVHVISGGVEDGAASVREAEVRRGDVYFVTAGARLSIAPGAEGLKAYYASCNDRIFNGSS